MKRVKKEIGKKLDHLTRPNLNDKNLMKGINSWVIPVAGCVMNVCNLGKIDLDELNMIVKTVLQRERFHGRKSSDGRLYSKKKESGGGLKSFKEVYDETKTRVPCYMAAATNRLIRVTWRNESRKNKNQWKRNQKKGMKKVEVTV